MGTANSYEGSGGGWTTIAGNIGEWLDSLPGADQDVDERPSSDEGSDARPDEADGGPIPDYAVRDLLRPLRGALGWSTSRSGGSADGPGGISGGGRAGGTTGRSPSGAGGRSRARAARTGGRLAAGYLALRDGNAAELQELGLDLEELRTHSNDPYWQAMRLVDAALEDSDESLEDAELRYAATQTAIWALRSEPGPTAEDVVRFFVTEYVYRVLLLEVGISMRSGRGTAEKSAVAEDRLKGTIAALARNVPIDPEGNGHSQITATILGLLDDSRFIAGLADE